MTSLRVGTGTAHVTITMWELEPGRRTLDNLKVQLGTAESLLTYGRIVEFIHSAEPNADIADFGLSAIFEARPPVDQVHALRLNSPLVVVIETSIAVALALQTLYRRVQDLRVHHARADTEVELQRLARDLIRQTRDDVANQLTDRGVRDRELLMRAALTAEWSARDMAKVENVEVDEHPER